MYFSPEFNKHTQLMNFPDNLLYTKDHEWVRIEGDVAYVGITDFAQKELGDIVYVDINTVGKDIAQHDVFGTVEAVKTVSDLFSPLSGTVSEFNKALDGAPELVNNDPYGEGWMIKLTGFSQGEVDGLMKPADYRSLVGA